MDIARFGIPPYDIFLNLEAAGGQELFRSDANVGRYGLYPGAANPRNNPDGLPIGVTKTVFTEGRWKGEYVGLTCSACHNGRLTYEGKLINIDAGVGNTFDLMGLSLLSRRVAGYVADPAKFDRLAARLGATSPESKGELRKRFEGEAEVIHVYRTRTLPTPIIWGPSRIDAISGIVNRVTSVEPRIPQNASTAVAPTKPPFLFNSPQRLVDTVACRAAGSDSAQPDRSDGRLHAVRSALEDSPAEGLFDSPALILNLQTIENALNRVAPPKWPEEVFGKIDRKKAAAGKPLFMKHCAGCHNAWPYTWTEANKYGKRWIQVGLIPYKYVGTDPGQFEDVKPYAITGQLAEYLPGPLEGQGHHPYR